MNETQNLIAGRAAEHIHFLLVVTRRTEPFQTVSFFFTFSSGVLIGDSDKQPTFFLVIRGDLHILANVDHDRKSIT